MESMEYLFPHHLREAKTAMEFVFFTVYISSLPDFKMWVEPTRESRGSFRSKIEGLKNDGR